MGRSGVELDRLEPQLLRELGVVGLDFAYEPLGVLAADEELDGLLRLGAYDGEDEHSDCEVCGRRITVDRSSDRRPRYT